MLRKPTFGQTTYWTVEEVVPEGKDPYWMTEWNMEVTENLDDWMETVRGNLEEDEMPEFKTEKFTVSNRDWMRDHVYGKPYDDFGTEVLDEDCPECGHLLVKNDHGVYCSDCKYINDALKEHHDEFTRIREKKPSPQFREPGQTLEEFMKKYNFEEKSIKRHSECATCKQPLEIDDFYRIKGYAIIAYNKGHIDGCENGPCVARPLGKEGEEWSKMLFGEGRSDPDRAQ